MPEPIVPTTGPDSVRIAVPPPVANEDRAQAASTHCSALSQHPPT
jgi:hypothetical protein